MTEEARKRFLEGSVSRYQAIAAPIALARGNVAWKWLTMAGAVFSDNLAGHSTMLM